MFAILPGRIIKLLYVKLKLFYDSREGVCMSVFWFVFSIAFGFAIGLIPFLVRTMRWLTAATKTVFAALLSGLIWLMTYVDHSLVENQLLNWFLIFLMVWIPMFILCGFPKINRAFDVMTSMVVYFLLFGVLSTLIINASINQSASYIDQPFFLFWQKNLWWIALGVSLIAPFLSYYLRAKFFYRYIDHYEVWYDEYDHELNIDPVYEREYMDLNEHCFSFGYRWLPFQKILASFIYSLYPSLVTIYLISQTDWVRSGLGAILALVLPFVIFFVGAYLMQIAIDRMFGKVAAKSLSKAKAKADSDPNAGSDI